MEGRSHRWTKTCRFGDQAVHVLETPPDRDRHCWPRKATLSLHPSVSGFRIVKGSLSYVPVELNGKRPTCPFFARLSSSHDRRYTAVSVDQTREQTSRVPAALENSHQRRLAPHSRDMTTITSLSKRHLRSCAFEDQPSVPTADHLCPMSKLDGHIPSGPNVA